MHAAIKEMKTAANWRQLAVMVASSFAPRPPRKNIKKTAANGRPYSPPPMDGDIARHSHAILRTCTIITDCLDSLLYTIGPYT